MPAIIRDNEHHSHPIGERVPHFNTIAVGNVATMTSVTMKGPLKQTITPKKELS